MGNGYGEFAEVYDLLTFNVPYDGLADLRALVRTARGCWIWAAERAALRCGFPNADLI